MECFLIKYLQIGNAAINRRDECLCKMKELFTSIRRTMRCELCNCNSIASYNTSKTQLHKRWVCCSVLRAAGGEVVTRLAEVESGVRGAGAGTHWDMLLGAPLLRHQTQYHPRIMIEMSCSGGWPDETSILTMSPFRKTDNRGLYV